MLIWLFYVMNFFLAGQFVPPENEDFLKVRTFFFGGGGQWSAQNVSAPYKNPSSPTGKILATQLL